MRQDDSWLSLVLHRRMIGGVNFAVIVTAPTQIPNLLIGPILHHFRGARIPTEEVFAHISAIISFERLVVTIQALGHYFQQRMVVILGQQPIPAATPNHLDNVPAGASEKCL